MNKKHGLVATAWMLGGGLLLNATIVEAQVASPADEYYAPQRSAPFTKRTPGLLPEMLRNADGSKDSTIARPIPPSNSLSAGHKINGTSSVPKKSSNRVLITPANHQNEATFQPSNQGDAAPSPIQKQLEEMYRKDGRPMPQMNFNQTPIPASGQVPNANGTQNAFNRPNTAQSNVVPPKSRSIFSKLNPFSRSKSAPAQLPNHSANPIQNAANRPPLVPPAPGANAINQAGGNRPNSFNNTAPQALSIPAAAQPAQSTQEGSQLPDSLPPVPGDPGYQAPAATDADALTIPPAPASVEDALENAFSDTADEKAEAAPSKLDETKPAETKSAETEAPETKSTEESNPFSGLSLDDEFGPVTKPAPAKLAIEPATTAAPSEGTPELSSDKTSLPPEALPAEPAKEDLDAKMKLIAERGELRGLKGFCPVALRDDRDLKNALPEHHSTFKGRTYYFSTAEAKVEFDERPQHYAPISGGQDVVLLKEKVTKEGSLDHAVWFKDRLYLFTSQKTLEQFVATPKEFAISE